MLCLNEDSFRETLKHSQMKSYDVWDSFQNNLLEGLMTGSGSRQCDSAHELVAGELGDEYNGRSKPFPLHLSMSEIFHKCLKRENLGHFLNGMLS